MTDDMPPSRPSRTAPPGRRRTKSGARSQDGPASRRARAEPATTPEDEATDPLRTENQARILDVAVHEFAEKGLAGARVAEIATKAGVNKQLLYYYFGSKKGLYDAVLASVLSISRETMSTLDNADFESVTEAFATGVNPTELKRRRLLRRLWMWEALERGANDIVRVEDRQATWAQVMNLLRHAVDQGEIDSRYDIEMLMLAVDAVLNGPWMQPQTTYLVTGLDPDDPRFRKRLAEFFRQLMAALAPPEAKQAGKSTRRKSSARR